jgi:xylulokinase
MISGLTLTSTRIDLVRAIMEGVVCRFAIILATLRERGVDAKLIRATGGGAASSWWMQLHADLTGVPVEIVAHEQPGTFGAAILAGVGAGIYESVSSAASAMVAVSRRYEPDPSRAERYGALRRRLELVVG